jgi:hypothetical protein
MVTMLTYSKLSSNISFLFAFTLVIDQSREKRFKIAYLATSKWNNIRMPAMNVIEVTTLEKSGNKKIFPHLHMQWF